MKTIYQKTPKDLKDIGVCSYIYWSKNKKHSVIKDGVEYILLGINSQDEQDFWNRDIPIKHHYKLVVECIHQGETDKSPVKRYAILCELSPTEVYKDGYEIPVNSHNFRGTDLGKSLMVEVLQEYGKSIENLGDVKCYLETVKKVC